MSDYVIVDREDLENLQSRFFHGSDGWEHVREILANAPPAEGRAVAWMWPETGEITTDPDMADGVWLPLFTDPADTEQPDNSGPDYPDGPWAEGWEERLGTKNTAQDESAKLRQISNALEINAFQRGELALLARMLEDTARYIEHTEAKYQCAIEGTDYYEGYEEGLKAAKQNKEE